jgi:uncharacterized membrane protein YfcA
MLMIFLWSLLLGAVAGFLAGLFGLGGGAVIVPVLVWLFSLQGFAPEQIMLLAVATSLSTMLVTSTSSLWAHHKLGAVLWPKVRRLVPTILLGASGGAVVAEWLPVEAMRWFFIGYLLYVALQMALQIAPPVGSKPENRWLDSFAGLMIGVLSAILGIGGGTMTVPYLVGRGVRMKNAVAVSSVCGLPIALSSTVTYVWLGWRQQDLPEWSSGYIYLPAFVGIALCSALTAPLGAKLANRLPTKQLKRYFSVVLVLLAVKMMWR